MPMPDPPQAVLETALYVDDLDEAARFYAEVIGLEEVQRVPGRHVFFGCGSGMVLLFDPQASARPSNGLPVPVHGAQGPGHMCFRVPGPTLEGWVQWFARRDVPIEADFHWPNGARSIYARDPSGNSIEVSEAKLWGRS